MKNSQFLEPNKEAPEVCSHEQVHQDEDDVICGSCGEHCSLMSCVDCEEDLGSDCCGAG